MSAEIDRLDSLMRKFGQLAEMNAKENMPHAVKNAMNIIQKEAKLRCRVDTGELRNSIRTSVEVTDEGCQGVCYTNKTYAPYVEFGTGPRGAAEHSGISPAVTPAYSQQGWYIPGDKIDAAIAEKYHFREYTYHLDGYLGYEKTFYYTEGQAASPFLYPALKDNETRVTRNIRNHLARQIKKQVGE